MEYRTGHRAGAWALLALGITATVLAVMLARGSERASASAFTVTKTADTADGACNADCSLREAIQAANGNGVGSFDTITVPGGMYTLTLAGSDTGVHNAAVGDLDVTNGLVTIDGAGPGVTVINGNGIDRIFDIKITTNLATIKDLTIAGGNAGANAGGGITIGNAAVVTIDNVIVDGNTAGLNGGGIYNVGSLTLNSSTVRNNVAGGFGGGVQNGTLGVGAIGIANTTIHNNTAAGLYGGGFNNEHWASLMNVTISGNLVAAANGSGGGVRHLAGTSHNMAMTNVTITSNQAATGGGFRRTTDGAWPELKNVIIAGNSGGNCAATNGSILSQGHNLSSDLSCPFGAAGDLQNISPNLGPLQNNGGPTLTHALAPGSPAINAGDNNGCAATDQRGFPRDGVCDIGAFEYGASAGTPTPAPTPTPSPITVAPDAFGNVDCDNGLGSVDALKVLRRSAGLTYTQTEPCEDIGVDPVPKSDKMQGDVDCSGDLADSGVSSVDALKLLRFSAGLSYSQQEPCPNIGS